MADERRRLTIAVSGGPDSLALLLLAQAALPGRVDAVTVDHGLRPESAAEARFVAQVCEDRAIRHHILEVQVRPGNVQDRARKARYAAIESWLAGHASDGDGLATAHHTDDQVETLAMRLNRGSGLAGLAGVRPRRSVVPDNGPLIALVRPLLHWRRSELGAIVEGAGLVAVEDPSNTDDAFDRARLRKVLAGADWIDPAGWAKSATLLAEAADMIDVFARREFRSEVTRVEDGFRYVPTGFRLIHVEVVGRILGEMGASATRAEIDRMCSRLRQGENASLAGVLASARLDVDPDTGADVAIWDFAPEPPRRTA